MPRMLPPALLLVGAAAVIGVIAMSHPVPPAQPSSVAGRELVALPSARTKGEMSLEEALAGRRSIREFSAERLTDAELGQLLWAAQGVTKAGGGRTAPSAGGLYPLELYAVTPDGIFRYVAASHGLEPFRNGDLRRELRLAALDQAAVEDAPAIVAITGVVARTSGRYGRERAIRYVDLEAGHAAQNLLLEAVALGLGGVPIGAFDDGRVREVLGASAAETPLYLLPVGHPRA